MCCVVVVHVCLMCVICCCWVCGLVLVCLVGRSSVSLCVVLERIVVCLVSWCLFCYDCGVL